MERKVERDESTLHLSGGRGDIIHSRVGGNTEARAPRNAKLLTTFHINGEWGRATSTGWATGKTRKCHTWRHLVGRPWLVDQCLSNIQAGHQARGWTVSKA